MSAKSKPNLTFYYTNLASFRTVSGAIFAISAKTRLQQWQIAKLTCKPIRPLIHQKLKRHIYHLANSHLDSHKSKFK